MADRAPWPYGGAANSRQALTLTPDGLLKSNRPLAGPLRMGTAPGAGPSGIIEGAGFGSDLGMDRISPRRFDPMGTGCQRWPREGSELISRNRRR